MIIVWGKMRAKPDCLDELLDISLAHVERSRTEPGCLHHSVQLSVEREDEIVFYEEWLDMDALQVHFKDSAARDFIRQSRAYTEPAHGDMKMFDASLLDQGIP